MALFLLFVTFFIFAARGMGIGMPFNIKSFRSKGGETFRDPVSVFQNLKPGAAFRTGLIPWIK
jgi:hypothetical protein